jgi:hypothetical protein
MCLGFRVAAMLLSANVLQSIQYLTFAMHGHSQEESSKISFQ